jgi:hypothetical protein
MLKSEESEERSMRRLFVVCILLFIGIPAAHCQVKVWEGTMSLAAVFQLGEGV